MRPLQTLSFARALIGAHQAAMRLIIAGDC
jgi:hypothetical protein